MKHEPYEHGPLVEAWLKEPTWLPETDLARVSHLVHQTPQRRSWLPFPGPQRSRLMLSATSIAAGAAAVALTTGVLLNALAPAPTSDPLPASASEVATAEATEQATEPAATAEFEQEASPSEGSVHITLPDPLPEGVTGGTIDTAEGTIRFARLTGEAGEIPALGTVMPWGEGLAAWEVGTELAEGGIGQLWSTTDGVTWQRESLPADLRTRSAFAGARDHDGDMFISSASDAHFLVQPRLDRIWRRESDGSWSPLDTTAITRARPTGWSTPWTGFGGPRLHDGELVLDVEYGYLLPRGQLGIPKHRTMNMHRLGDARYALCPYDYDATRRNESKCSAKDAAIVLRFKENDKGLVVRDDRTGERYGLLAGADASQLYSGYNSNARASFVLDGDTFKPASRAASEGRPANALRQQPASSFPKWDGSAWVDSLDLPDFERDSKYDFRWGIDVGGKWIDLSDHGFPELQYYVDVWGQGWLGNAALFQHGPCTDDIPECDGAASLWIVTGPEGR